MSIDFHKLKNFLLSVLSESEEEREYIYLLILKLNFLILELLNWDQFKF